MESKYPMSSKTLGNRISGIYPAIPTRIKTAMSHFRESIPPRMVDLLSAQRGYQGNVAAMTAIKDMILRSIDLMK
jgi:hypothetical protein